MKKLLSRSVAFALMAMFASGSVLAQDQYQDNRHDRDHHSQNQDHRDHDRHDDRHDRHADRRDHDQGHGRVHYANWQDRGRHEGWYKRGGYLPVEYRTRYVVTDWRHDRLRPPPRGYHWVRSDDGDFLLVAITSGIIVDLILQH